MLRFVMDYGERRHVRIKIINIKGEPFSIISANYELINSAGIVLEHRRTRHYGTRPRCAAGA